MHIDPKKIIAKVKNKLAEDNSDEEYYTFKDNTIKQTVGRDYSLKEWIKLYLDDFSEDIIEVPLANKERERLFDNIKETIEKTLETHIKKFFKENNNQVKEESWDEEVENIKKQIKKHYQKMSKDIELYASEYIRDLNNKLKLA